MNARKVEMGMSEANQSLVAKFKKISSSHVHEEESMLFNLMQKLFKYDINLFNEELYVRHINILW